METKERFRKRLVELFHSQKLASLSTQKDGQPYASLVAFVASDDLGQIYFATPTTTRKYTNLKQNPSVSLLVHNSSNMATDIRQAMAVTVSGDAVEVPESRLAAAQKVYLGKQPHMSAFVRSPNTAIIEVTVTRYDVVAHFQDVTVLEIQEDRMTGP